MFSICIGLHTNRCKKVKVLKNPLYFEHNCTGWIFWKEINIVQTAIDSMSIELSILWNHCPNNVIVFKKLKIYEIVRLFELNPNPNVSKET